ncbi:hypothetical protein A3E39_00145 [Candidatus Uhrbacteria bacterium RIFCSPHIGHO2_12_FULL_60_25]|uniref:Uncharacterized protein n=1 Tax=Candidatus Uhrbacteria bacterium RIFCSPHIGHO2_12_FULL_60_25 TaxID=1802399 RepID=A0A1F7UP91_9BACT|nr:MAG: hypothetical protein A3D73_01435 [Candidatus Uhrbacteria bacterium RIFCSPHIGHO2_02_FULL_60_44]OGL79517.1 MAG: hypothetical protein A3E39_00145 [Candidatus Uhrbacteria bacterium RIFCSPHIGHO2_12_FULL_60_25]
MTLQDDLLTLARILPGPLDGALEHDEDHRLKISSAFRMPGGFGDGVHYLRLMKFITNLSRIYATSIRRIDHQIVLDEPGLTCDIEDHIGRERAHADCIAQNLTNFLAASQDDTTRRVLLLGAILSHNQDWQFDQDSYVLAILPPVS